MSWSIVSAMLREAANTVAPAIVLHVRYEGEIVFEEAVGCWDPETPTGSAPLTPDALFDLASVTKLFTATAFMRLVEAGQVALDTPVADIIPEFGGERPIGEAEDPLTKEMLPPDPQFAGQAVRAEQVTFRHLLTHTSGLAAWRSLYRQIGPVPPAPWEAPSSPGVRERIRRGVEAICRFPFLYPPDECVVYSDLGLILLGEAISRLMRQRLDHAIRELVLAPLGLSQAGFRPLDDPQRADVSRYVPTEHCAWRQRRLRGEVHDENAAGLGGVAGHAGLFATAAEVATLGQSYLGGDSEGTPRLLQPETVREMTREHVRYQGISRGLGWLRRAESGASCGSRFGPESFGHTGYTGTSLWIDPQRALVVSLMTNRVYHGRNPEAITRLRPAVHDAVVEAIA